MAPTKLAPPALTRHQVIAEALVMTWNQNPESQPVAPLTYSLVVSTWTPKVCKIMAFMAIIMGLVRAIILHTFGV